MRIFWIALWLPALCAASDKCPWLNQATAGGVLGGEVTSAAIELSKSGDTGHCDYVRTEGSISRHLFIEVNISRDHASYKAQCASEAAPVKAIGNEAVTCAFEGKPGEIAQQVAGRVRDRMFLVRVSTNDPRAAAAGLREKARSVAEQVAGFLF